MYQNKKRNLNSVEYLLRSSGWLVFLNAEGVAGPFLKFTSGYLDYYGVAIFLAALLVIALHRLGPSPLIRDLKEICLYDVLIQIYGLILHLMHFDANSYWVLATAIPLLKFIRVIWWGKNLDGDLLAAWPTFGFVGFFDKAKVAEPISRSQQIVIYGTCGAALLTAFNGLHAESAAYLRQQLHEPQRLARQCIVLTSHLAPEVPLAGEMLVDD